MKAKVIRIGNSKGIRLPKAVLEQVGLGEEVILEASRGTIVIRPALSPRAGWDIAFQEMAQTGDDKLPDSDIPASRWDHQEWQW